MPVSDTEPVVDQAEICGANASTSGHWHHELSRVHLDGVSRHLLRGRMGSPANGQDGECAVES